jgi:hypothetical protein
MAAASASNFDAELLNCMSNSSRELGGVACASDTAAAGDRASMAAANIGRENRTDTGRIWGLLD